jgi:hypothetical protein
MVFPFAYPLVLRTFPPLFMSETNQPSQTVQINLADLARRYTGALQRTFDIAAASFGALRTQTEKDYEEVARSLRFMPASEVHSDFNTIRPFAEAFLTRQLLNEALSTLLPFLEDARSVAALAKWKSEGAWDQGKVQRILGEDRQAFLRLSFPDKMELLKEFGLTAPNAAFIDGYIKFLQCLTRGGTVIEADTNEGNELVINLTGVQLMPAEQGKPQSGRLVEIPRKFAVGSKAELKREEVLSLFATISVFMSAILSALQQTVQKLLPTETQPQPAS